MPLQCCGEGMVITRELQWPLQKVSLFFFPHTFALFFPWRQWKGDQIITALYLNVSMRSPLLFFGH